MFKNFNGNCIDLMDPWMGVYWLCVGGKQVGRWCETERERLNSHKERKLEQAGWVWG